MAAKGDATGAFRTKSTESSAVPTTELGAIFDPGSSVIVVVVAAASLLLLLLATSPSASRPSLGPLVHAPAVAARALSIAG
ncbi:hypothetical protein EV121DRAFT_297556 [Schizophyllum commune]